MEKPESHNRHREIAGVLAKNGFDWLWSDWGIGRIFGAFRGPEQKADQEGRSQAERLRVTLEELGPTFIKIGQMLSTRPDLLPPEYIEELVKLQDHAPQVPFELIAESIRDEFGREPDEVFQRVDGEPRAAASISQVHNAMLFDGTPVVIKVRRPGIVAQVEQDLAIIGQVARFLVNNTEIAKRVDFEGLVDEFSQSLRNELDFIREGQNSERIAAQFTDNPGLIVPTIYWDYSTSAILTMQQISGIKIDHFDELDAAGISRRELATRCADIAMVQVLEYGFFHADPHPGNFFVQPDGSVALIDFGMVGRLGDRLRNSLVRLAMAISNHDSDRLIDELLALGAARQAVDRSQLKRDLEHILNRYEGLSLGSISAANVFGEITSISFRHGLNLPSDLVMVVRVIAMDEGLGRSLDPDFNFFEFARPYFVKFWKQSHSLKSVAKKVRKGVIELGDTAMELPEHAMRLVGMLERGELVVTSRLESHDAMSRSVRQSANRVAISILTASLIVGLSILAAVFRPSGSQGWAYLFLKLLLAGVMVSGAWLAFAFWKSNRE